MLKEQFDLSGKIALVTGASQGIGKGIALGLAEYGAEVIILYHKDRKQAEAVAQELEVNGGRVIVMASDFSKPDAARELRIQLGKKNKLPDILVVNASVQVAKDWQETTESDFDFQVNTNFKSTLFLFQEFIPKMIERGWGRVVTIGSVQQQKPHPAMIVYAATKSAVDNMVRNVAMQIAEQGVTVNNLAPGVIGTPRLDEPVPEVEERIDQRMTTPTGSIGDPIDCAAMALLLCSDAGKFITGQNIYVDGGMSL
ncbi:SDR family NAD(P)-dependent oxidoreductase [Persicitalea jodogahamensis]|uniref:Short-chain dehydrogenase n=1 Tax=Persicitalea jodogahamensis TaxID=402147 RepID=A0A8J3DCC7_9BACT|nr:SDR family oxidoreductase [Persicitalea jodogahamensis]GHB81755.1 short-chain dehydrogenase [Persicitalea jodogahamensis]